jgi:hypothetical protein
MKKKNKLNIRRETLRVLNPVDASNVVGGAVPISQLPGCSLGHPCTAGCTTTSVQANCDPPSILQTCTCPPE